MVGEDLNGIVAEYCDAKGLGSVTCDDGRAYLFHVVEIADGTRTVEVGQSVRFRLVPRFGTFEAGRLRKV